MNKMNGMCVKFYNYREEFLHVFVWWCLFTSSTIFKTKGFFKEQVMNWSAKSSNNLHSPGVGTISFFNLSNADFMPSKGLLGSDSELIFDLKLCFELSLDFCLDFCLELFFELCFKFCF